MLTSPTESVAKGMVVGRMPNGQQLVVGGGDGAVAPSEAPPPDAKGDYYHSPAEGYGGGSQLGASQPGYSVEKYSNATNAPPAYPHGGVGEPARSTLPGGNVREKQS